MPPDDDDDIADGGDSGCVTDFDCLPGDRCVRDFGEDAGYCEGIGIILE